ncbi:retrovirus-related pol polyprotein from transposon TNT 1-94 [Tanacetum coccineum]
MMLLAQEITQKFSTPTNNRLRTSSNTMNQAVIHAGRVDFQTKNAGYGRNGNKNAGRQNRNQSNPGRANVQCYNCNSRGHYACDCPKPKVHDAKYFKEQILLAMKDKAGGNLNDEENDFMLDNPYEAVSKKFMGTVRFENDHFTAITGYEDYVQGSLTIHHVYYVEGLRHKLFSIGQYCDGDLEVAFHLNTCYVRNLEGEDLLTGPRDSNLYTISISELATSSPIQRSLQAQVLKVRSDNGTEFKNEKLRTFYAKLGITHNTSTARTPQQNGVVERINQTLVKAAHTMLIFLKTLEFIWAEAIATACFTHNRSLVHTRYNKTLYDLIKGRKPNVQYFYVLRSLCYPTNDRDDLGKMKLKADSGIFIGYFESSRGFRIYNRRTKKIMETIHVKFDELTTMASECNNLGPGFNCSNFQDSLEDSQSVPSKEDLANVFGPLYEEYYATRTPEVSDDSAANTLDNEDTPSSSSIVIEEDEAP